MIEPDSADVAVGDVLTRKQSALKGLGTLAREVGSPQWTAEQNDEAIKALVEVRQKVAAQGDYEEIRVQMGQVLSKAAGRKDSDGGTYGKQGKANVPTQAPASRIDRIQ